MAKTDWIYRDDSTDREVAWWVSPPRRRSVFLYGYDNPFPVNFPWMAWGRFQASSGVTKRKYAYNYVVYSPDEPITRENTMVWFPRSVNYAGGWDICYDEDIELVDGDSEAIFFQTVFEESKNSFEKQYFLTSDWNRFEYSYGPLTIDLISKCLLQHGCIEQEAWLLDG